MYNKKPLFRDTYREILRKIPRRKNPARKTGKTERENIWKISANGLIFMQNMIKKKEKPYINTSFQQKSVRIYHSEWYHSWQNPHDKKAEKRINGHLCTQNGT